MSQPTPTDKSHSYKQGHSASTISTHLLRTAESEASFLLPHIQPGHHILDIGCGPGTITTGFRKYATRGRIVGIDVSAPVLEKARALAVEAAIPTSGPGSVSFEEANVLARLPFADDSFDIVFAAHVFGHLPPPEQPLRALGEMRRVLKPGGIVAVRDAGAMNFFPASCGLDRLWVGNFKKIVLGTSDPAADTTPGLMPGLLRRAGFGAEGKEVRVGAGATVYAKQEERKWMVERAMNQLKEGDEFYRSWLEAGITEGEIVEMKDVARKWAETEGAWFVITQSETMAWK